MKRVIHRRVASVESAALPRAPYGNGIGAEIVGVEDGTPDKTNPAVKYAIYGIFGVSLFAMFFLIG